MLTVKEIYTAEEAEKIAEAIVNGATSVEEAIFEINKAESSFDLDFIFGETCQEEEAPEEDSSFQDWQNEMISILESRIEGYKIELSKWEAKSYKKSKGSAFVGSELDGEVYSFNYINKRRKFNAIQRLESEIAEDLENISIIKGFSSFESYENSVFNFSYLNQ